MGLYVGGREGVATGRGGWVISAGGVNMVGGAVWIGWEYVGSCVGVVMGGGEVNAGGVGEGPRAG